MRLLLYNGSMSTHKVEIIKIVNELHPNADRLSLVKVHGWQVVVGKDEFIDGSLAVYVPPEYVVSITPGDVAKNVITASTLEMLSRNCRIVDAKNPSGEGYVHGYRIKVKKFRGEWSQGLLLKAPSDVQEGDDVMQLLGIGYYEPPMESSFAGEAGAAPEIPVPKYDIESLAQFNTVIVPGTQVVVTEKIHGAQSRFVYDGSQFYCGSKHEWKKESPSSIWWRTLEMIPNLKSWLKEHPRVVVLGEIYGSGVQDLHYGLKNKDIHFSAFDIWDKQFLSYEKARAISGNLPWVPVLFQGPYEEGAIKRLAEGTSTVTRADHIREGVVVRTKEELTSPTLGRIVLKVISNAYLERA